MSKPLLVSRRQIAKVPGRFIDDRDRWFGVDGCWEWSGSIDLKWGYGKVAYRMPGGERHSTSPHRLAYVLMVGDIDQDLTIDHLCRNAACWRPDHLEAVPLNVNILRGEAVSARNARKEACDRCGGAFSIGSDGNRRCTSCRDARERRYADLLRAACAATGLTRDEWRARNGRSTELLEKLVRENAWDYVPSVRERDRCPRGHALAPDNLEPGPLRRGSRTCHDCVAITQKARRDAIRAAAVVLGLTHREYVAEYGSSRHVAEAIVAARGVQG